MRCKFMKIEIFSDSYLPGVGGTENVVINLAKALLNKKQKVAVACPKYKTDPQNLGYPVFRSKSFLVKKPQSYCAISSFDKKFKKDIEDFQPNIIHAHSVNDMLSRAIKLGKKLNVPVIATIHTKIKDCWLQDTKSHLITSIMLHNMKTLLNKVDVVTTVSYFMKEVLISYGIKKPIKVVRNGCAKPKCKNIESLKQDFKKKYNLTDDTLLFLSLGRVEKVKNLEFTLNMLAKYKNYNGNFKFFVVGMGSALNYYKKLTKKLGLENHVNFLGFVSETELNLILARSDLLLFTNTFDTDGLVVAEAACYETPSLVLKNTGPAERIRNNITGFTIENNLNSYLKTVVDVTSNHKLLKIVGENAFKQIPNSWDNISKQYLEIYEKQIAIKNNVRNKS